MHLEVRIHHWVLWWLYVGVVLGVIALANILGQNLTRPQEHLVLIIGVIHWALGGVVCWAFEGVHFAKPTEPEKKGFITAATIPEHEWHPASDFVLPGAAKHVLPPEYFGHTGKRRW